LEPLGMVTDAETVVPLGPTTSRGKVTRLLLGVRVIVADAVIEEFTTLAAVTVTVCGLLIVAGAVYVPFRIVPNAGFSDQVTAGLLAPVTEALKAVAAPAVSDTTAGPTVTPTACSVTVALAVFVRSAKLVAVTMMFCWLAIIAGA
jgi:hypothetical protein